MAISKYEIIKNLDLVHYIDWESFCEYSFFEEEFVREFQDHIEWESLSQNEKVLSKFSDKFFEDFDKQIRDSSNWGDEWNYGYNGYHRTVGPACLKGKKKEYWYRGKKVPVKNMKEYKRWLKLKLFI